MKINLHFKFLVFFTLLNYSITVFSQAGIWNSTTKTGSWSGTLQVGPGDNENTRNITFAVSNISIYARPIEVQISLQHVCIRDMDIHIISPANTVKELATDSPNNCDNRTWSNIKFRDDASTSSIPNSNVTNTTYIPENWLNDFCENPNGTWTIRVRDDANGDQGTLTSVSIIFQEPNGDQVTYQTGSGWNAYVYRGGNFDCYRGSFLQNGSSGYNNMNFSDIWADNDLGIPINVGIAPFRHSQHSISYRKNINFSRKFYRTTTSHDDFLELKTNNSTIYNGGCCPSTSSPNINTFLFDGSTDMEIRFRGTGGPERLGFDVCEMAGDYRYNIFPDWNAYAFNRTDLPSNNFNDLNTYAGWFTTVSSTGSTFNRTLINNNWGNGSHPRSGTGVSGSFTNSSVGSCAGSPITGNDNFSVRYLSKRDYSSDGIYVYESRTAIGSGSNNDDGRRLFIDKNLTGNIITSPESIFNNYSDGSGLTASNPLLIAAGTHGLIYDFREGSGGALAALSECQMDAAGTSNSLGNATATGTSAWNLYFYNQPGDYSFPMAQYRGTNTNGSSTPTSATLSMSWSDGVAPNRIGQVCGTTMNYDFSMKALLTRSFNKGIYTIQSGADDWSRIKMNNSAFLNEHNSCCTIQNTDVALNGSTVIEYQMRESGGPGSATVNISCQSAIAGTLISNQTCGSTGAVTLNWSGGKGFYTWEHSSDGSTWTTFNTESNTVNASTSTISPNPTTTSFYRVRVESCNGTPIYSNTVSIIRATIFTGDVVIATNTTLGGVININGNFTLNAGVTITVQQGCPLEINANNITINGIINANGQGNLGGAGGTVGGYWSQDGNTDGRGMLWCWDKDNCRELRTIGGGTGGTGTGLGAGAGGSVGNNGFGKKQACNNWDDDGGRVGGSGGGGGGGGGSYGGVGGVGGIGGVGGGSDACHEGNCGNYSVGAGGNGGTISAIYGNSASYDIELGSGGGGAGGGGTGYSNRTVGSVGGNGGGAIALKACNLLTIGSTATLSTNGSDGAVGGAGGDWTETGECCGDLSGGCDERTRTGRGGGGGGSGGGSGGGILLSAFGLMNINTSATINANGGNAGLGGVGENNGQAGGGGGGGRVKLFTNPCYNNIVPSSVSLAGGTGQNNGGTGIFSVNNHPNYTALNAGNINTTSYSICYTTSPSTGMDAEASTGGVKNASLSCNASLPAYQYQWYVTRTHCTAPTTGTSATQNVGWTLISGAINEDLSTSQILSGINTVGNTSTAAEYCFQRRTQSSQCYAWTTTVSVTILQDVSSANANFTLSQCVTPTNPYAILSATTPTVGSGIWSIVSGPGSLTSTTANPTTVTGLSTIGIITEVQWTVAHATSPTCPKSLVSPLNILPPTLDLNTVSLQSTSSAQYFNCRSCAVVDGITHTYFDNNGNIIAKIIDPSNSSSMGETEVCVGYDYNANLIAPNNTHVKSVVTSFMDLQPYLPRYWTIDPATKNGQDITVTLYFTKAEYDALKVTASNTQYLFNDKSELRVTKFDNGASGVFTAPPNFPAVNNSAKLIFPTIEMYPNPLTGPNYATTFVVNSFSTFYIHPNRFPFAPLPVELVSFIGYNVDNKINKLEWKTASENNTATFEIEKSVDGNSWNTIGTQKAAGNSSIEINYSYDDVNPIIGNNYYRLRILDNDATFEFSNVINIPVENISTEGIMSLYPNPTNDNVNIVINSNSNYSTDISIINLLGQEMLSIPINISKGTSTIHLNTNELASGTYMIYLLGNNSTLYRQKFVKK
ncbi:MAG TPA: T9SS type A sorting domain-containing protein [Chitinophagales bacterium]|jgi:subtilisin-like proprotein convertase family protein|nr:T9SS type A sorting domain-containing protein [Chitinophagales bacterium]HQW78281.1 T9SS type A sorting domain-containing protein [Chitinophagales bacterium]HRB18475.1 T9SS type A sorting domain-containing protein [Chitinophagales bacterium]HRB68543.1 T9SS type A sorting domain-containing protein [Chitinophagales bacterium]HRB92172.1 T9SS type A sorting domain-containing protein [Chitinophagales bacterium]